MKIKNHSDIYKVLEKKADLENNKVPVSQLPSNVVHSGLTATIPIAETPTIDADGVTLRFVSPHNLTVGQQIIIEENGGVIPIGIRDKFTSNTKFPQLIDKRIYSVYAVPSANTIQIGNVFSNMGPSTLLTLNKTIVPVGNAFATSASQNCVEKDSLGNIYIAFYDGSVSGKATVKRFDGTNWNIVGAVGFTSEIVSNLSFAIASDNTLYIAFRGNTTSKCIVMKFDGTNWVTVGASLPTVGSVSYVSLAVYGTTPYVAYQDSNQSNKCVVMKYDGSAWVTVGTNPISAGTATYIKMKIATNGNIYVAYSDGSTNPINKATVKMYDGTAWNTVGVVGFSANAVSYVFLTLSSDNTPHIAYTESSGMQGFVAKYTAGIWSNIGAGVSTAYSPTIIIATDGTIYLTYFNFGPMKTYMTKLVAGAWLTGSLVANDSSALGLLINDEYHICGQSVTSLNYVLGKFSAVDNGSGAWRVANLATRYDIPNLDFNSDGGTYEIDIKGLLLQKTASSLLYLTVNDLATGIYFSPYNTSSYGSTMYSLLAISSSINDFTMKISIKRMSSDVIKVEVSSSIMSSFMHNSFTGTLVNACFVGYIKGAGIENVSKLSLIATGCPFLNYSQIIVRRVINNAT